MSDSFTEAVPALQRIVLMFRIEMTVGSGI